MAVSCAKEWLLNLEEKGDVVYHVTTEKGADSVIKEGFKASPRGRYGPGVYLWGSLESATEWAKEMFDSGPGIIVAAQIDDADRSHLFQTNPDDGFEDGYVLQLPKGTTWTPPRCVVQ